MSDLIPVTNEDEAIFHEIHARLTDPQNATVFKEAADYVLTQFSVEALREENVSAARTT